LVAFRGGLFTLAVCSLASCLTDPAPAGVTDQAVISAPLPGNLNLILNASTSVTAGAFSTVAGDVGSAGQTGSVLFDAGSSQNFGDFHVLANSVTVAPRASVGHVYGNDIRIDGSAFSQTLGFDPGQLPQVPAVTAAAPGRTAVSVTANQARQICPGAYGAISLAANSLLSLNGGVYQASRLALAEGATLEATEPVVILVAGGLTTATGAHIRPATQVLNAMSAANIRIEVVGAVSLGDRSELRAHVLAGASFTTGAGVSVRGAVWARSIAIGTDSAVAGEGVFSLQSPSVPPPCNDNNACTLDTCEGSGTAVGFCRNAAVAVGTSCGDGNACNGDELCNAAGQCQPGTLQPTGTSCRDGDVCNGDEACDGSGTCVPGAPPAVDDHNACTADACDAEAGVSHTPLPDGTTCNDTGVCAGGACQGGTIRGAFSYSASNTGSANQNTVNVDIPLVAGQTLSIGTCGVPGASGSGDTYLRLFDPFNVQVAANDDSCGLLSFISFRAGTTGTYQVHAGCFSSDSCSGTVAYTITND
jgi:hypothetical protein